MAHHPLHACRGDPLWEIYICCWEGAEPCLACSTTTLALGSRQLAQQGAIVTRLTAIEEMAGMTLLCSDKTGTLTLNTMVIQVCTLKLIQ